MERHRKEKIQTGGGGIEKKRGIQKTKTVERQIRGLYKNRSQLVLPYSCTAQLCISTAKERIPPQGSGAALQGNIHCQERVTDKSFLSLLPHGRSAGPQGCASTLSKHCSCHRRLDKQTGAKSTARKSEHRSPASGTGTWSRRRNLRSRTLNVR